MTHTFHHTLVSTLLMMTGLFVGGDLTLRSVSTAAEIVLSTVDCGGETSAGGTYALTGTIGQPDAGESLAGDGFAVVGGFWAGASAPCFGDLDGSNDVGFGDVLTIIGAWGACGVSCPEDLSGNGTVDFADILAVIGAWGGCS